MLARLRWQATFVALKFSRFKNLNIFGNISFNKCCLKSWLVCGDSQHLLRQHLLLSTLRQHLRQQMLTILLNRLRWKATFVASISRNICFQFVGFEIWTCSYCCRNICCLQQMLRRLRGNILNNFLKATNVAMNVVSKHSWSERSPQRRQHLLRQHSVVNKCCPQQMLPRLRSA